MASSPAPTLEALHLLDLTPGDARSVLDRWVTGRGLPGYRAGQIHGRLWQAPVESWQRATHLSSALRADPQEAFPLEHLTQDVVQQSADGTRKYLWRPKDGEA